MTNLATNLKDAAGQFASNPAIRLGPDVLTYGDLDELAARVSGHLKASGLEPGDRVALMLPNIPAFAVLYYGILRAGGAVVPMNPLLRDREIRHYLNDSGARTIFAADIVAEEAEAAATSAEVSLVAVGADFLDVVAQWPADESVCARGDDDNAVVLYTSGTTGTPKGAQLTHANMRANAAIAATQLLELGEGDVIMGCLPLFHSFGQTCGLNTAVVSGATLTLIPRFDPIEVLKIVERDRVTVFEGVPTMYGALIQAGADVADTSTLRMCISGGAALPAETLRSFADTFGVEVLEGYGLSETSPVASFNRPGASRVGSIGLPIDGVEMRVVGEDGTEVPAGEVGEVAVRGHNVMRGYWQRPDATAEVMRDGWLHTGDMAYRDDDGFFFIVDRKKDLIIRGGFNVYPREIEEVFYEHPAVLEAAVIGIPHPTHGEEVAAAVVLRPGAEATAAELKDYVKQRVAAYKYPREVWLADDLPKGPTGKILKREIAVPERSTR